MKKSELQQIIQEEITDLLSKPGVQDKDDSNVINIMKGLEPRSTNLKNMDTPKEVLDLFSDLLTKIQDLNKNSLSDQEIIIALTNLLSTYRKKK